ncbi:MAG: aminotransferase class I/II-fold pyridoxal phosphate-dependent enzyme [Thermosulfidibacteraceae bacterium]|jgi:histidinol-phosphate/aromatic aminotransferase/cobyric acid decarboxylase-like protein
MSEKPGEMLGFMGVSEENNIRFVNFQSLVSRLVEIWNLGSITLTYPILPEYSDIFGRLGLDVNKIKLREEEFFRLCIGEIGHLIEEDTLFVVSNPLYPAGFYLDRERVKALMRLCRSKGAFVLFDETFAIFAEDVYYDDELMDATNAIFFRFLFDPDTFRLSSSGFVVGNLSILSEISPYVDLSKSDVLDDASNLFRRVRELRWKIEEEKRMLVKELLSRGFKAFESRAPYILVKCTKSVDFDLLRNAGINVKAIPNDNYSEFILVYLKVGCYKSIVELLGRHIDEDK